MRIEDCNLSRSEVSALIDEWIFSETDRAMLKDRLLDGMVFEKLAEKHGYSVTHTKRKIYKLQERLFSHI